MLLLELRFPIEDAELAQSKRNDSEEYIQSLRRSKNTVIFAKALSILPIYRRAELNVHHVSVFFWGGGKENIMRR